MPMPMPDVRSLATDLVAIPSVTRDEGAVGGFVAAWLRERGWTVTEQEVTPGRSNVWARRAGGGVTFSTHIDTVPPFIAPRREGARLYGRGSCDAKGIAAAMIAAAERLVADGEERIDLLFVVGEERGSDGALRANTLPATSRFLINGEPTESHVAIGCKGALRVTLRTQGREAHSAYAELGTSAILPMAALLADIGALRLPTDPVLGPSTVNVGVIQGGTGANIVPGECTAELMIRVVGEAEPVKAAVERWVAGRAEITYPSFTPAQRFPEMPGFPAKVFAYTTDASLLTNWGTPLLYGPGSITVAHTPDEFIDVAELEAAVDTYVRLARTLLAA
jgi:acetylornithine deacetylase